MSDVASVMNEIAGGAPAASEPTTTTPPAVSAQENESDLIEKAAKLLDGAAAEDAAAPADTAQTKEPAKADEDKAPAKPTPREFIALRNEQKQIRAERAKVEAARKEIEAKRAEFEALSKRAEETDSFLSDPDAYIRAFSAKHGIDPREAFRRFTERLVTGKSPIEEHLTPVQRELAAVKEEIARVRQERVEAERALAIQRVHHEIASELTHLADDFPLLGAYDAADVAKAAFNYLQAEHAKSGIYLDYRDALAHLHSNLETEERRLSDARAKRGARIPPKVGQPGSQQTQPASNGAARAKPVGTLTDADAKATSMPVDYRTLDESDRIRAAAKLLE